MATTPVQVNRPRGGAVAAAGKRRDRSVVVLDGLIVDLYNRVTPVVDYHQLSAEEHFSSLQAIQRILLQIQKHEKSNNGKNVAPGSAEDRIQFLNEWLQERGIKVDGLQFASGLPEGSGVVASRDFSSGDMLATVSLEHLMTTATALQEDRDVQLIFASDPWFRKVPSLILAMHLLFQKHASSDSPSRWAGYIRSLPGQGAEAGENEGTDFFQPLALSPDAVAILKGTTALVEYHRIFRTIAKQYCHMRTVLRNLAPLSPSIQRASDSWFTYEEFRWAVSTVMRRQNEVPVPVPDVPVAAGKQEKSVVENGEPTSAHTPASPSTQAVPQTAMTIALIPVLDMFNHEEGPITSHFDLSSLTMELAAKRDFKKGEQVYISYGFRPNVMFLLYSGFVPKANSRDRIRLSVELPPSDPLYGKKLSLLKWLGLPPSAQLDLFVTGRPSNGLAKWLKVAAETKEENISAETRLAISARMNATSETQDPIQDSQGSNPSSSSSGPSSESAPVAFLDTESLSPSQGSYLANVCNKRLDELHQSKLTSHVSSDSPVGLGLGLASKGMGSKPVILPCELDVLRQLRDSEEAALKRAVELCTAP